MNSDNILRKLLHPGWQALLAAGLILLFGLVDLMLPHRDTFLDPGHTPWAISTAMILCFVILNAITVIRTGESSRYWILSALFLAGLLAYSYLLSWLLSGRQMDEVGSFRWLWFVLVFVWLIFHAIVRSIRRIVHIAIRQDEQLRGEE